MQNFPISKGINPFDVIRLFIAPLGAFISLVGFVLPWATVTIIIFGSTNLAAYQLEIYLWLLPPLCLAIIVASFLPILIKNAWVTRFIVAAMAALGLLIVFVRLLILFYEMYTAPAGSKVGFHVGIPVTGFGFVMALVGGMLLPSFHKKPAETQ